MKNIQRYFLKSIFTLLALMPALLVWAQNVQVVASGFNGAVGISLDANGNLWVAESGSGMNDGKVSLITPGHAVHTVVTGLPSYFDTMTHETPGPWRAYVDGNQLWVLIGGSPQPNAGSLITFDLSGYTAGDPPLTMSQASSIVHISSYVLGAGFMESNPFRAVWEPNGDAVIVDAAANSVLRRKASDGSFSVLHTFPPIPNSFTPFPPFIDYVPTAIARNPAGGYYVTNLSGFPFLPGLSQVVKMDAGGQVTPFGSGLSQSVDMEVDPVTGDVYVLQFGLFDSTFSPVFNSAKITRITPAGVSTVVAAGFGPSSGMALDGAGGAYVTHLFTNQVLHLSLLTAAHEQTANLGQLSASPNPATSTSTLVFSLREAAEVDYSLHSSTGAGLRTVHLGRMTAGEHQLQVDLEGFRAGLYYLTLYTPQGVTTVRIGKF